MFCDLVIFIIIIMASGMALLDYIQSKQKKDKTPNYYAEQKKIIADKRNQKENLLIQTNLAGVTYENRLEIIKRMNIGDTVLILPENDNLFDKNALAVYTTDKSLIGYISKDLAKDLSEVFTYTNPEYYIVEGKVVNFTTHEGSITGLRIEFIPPDEATGKNKYLTETIFWNNTHR